MKIHMEGPFVTPAHLLAPKNTCTPRIHHVYLMLLKKSLHLELFSILRTIPLLINFSPHTSVWETALL